MSEDRTKALFDPINHGFFVLEGHQPPWKVRYSEFQNRPCVNGTHDYHRLNLYLTQDGEFVTVWFGSLDPMAIETLFLNNGVESVDYDEPFFRGYIESREQAEHILQALRPMAGGPQLLKIDPNKGLICEMLV